MSVGMSVGTSIGTVRSSIFYRRAHGVVGCALHGMWAIEMINGCREGSMCRW